MFRHTLAPLALELRSRFDSDAFAGRGRVTLANGTIIDAERKARSLLADVDRIARADGWGWLTHDEAQALHDDLSRLLALLGASVRL